VGIFGKKSRRQEQKQSIMEKGEMQAKSNLSAERERKQKEHMKHTEKKQEMKRRKAKVEVFVFFLFVVDVVEVKTCSVPKKSWVHTQKDDCKMAAQALAGGFEEKAAVASPLCCASGLGLSGWGEGRGGGRERGKREGGSKLLASFWDGKEPAFSESHENKISDGVFLLFLG